MLRTSAKWIAIYLLEFIAIVLAVVIFSVGAVMWRLSSGPVPLDFLRADVQAELAKVFEGDVVALGELEARFDPDRKTLVLLARDVVVAESGGEVVARAPLIETGLAIEELFLGRIVPADVNIIGGSVSIVRRADGAVGAGLGTVERVAGQARLTRRGGDDSASLFELLRDPANNNGLLGRLRHIAIENAAVRIVDEITGIAWFVDDAGVRLDRDGDHIFAELGGRLATPSGFAPIDIRIEAGAALDSLLLEARVENLSLSSVAPHVGAMASLRYLDAPLSLNLAVSAFRETGIQTASLDLDVGQGQIVLGEEATPFHHARLQIDFDPIVGELTIVDGEISAQLISTRFTGRAFDIGHYVGALPTRWNYEFETQAGALDLGPIFARPPTWDGLSLAGQVDASARAISFERLELTLGPLVADLAGEASLTQTQTGDFLPNLRLNGPLQGNIEPELVLAYWPLEVADGAREWVEQGILGGRFYNAQFALDLDADSIIAGRLPNERMTLSFDFEDADVRYVSTMTPIHGAHGSAVMRGNSFAVVMDGGQIGEIVLSDGFVDMPRLNPKGAIARYGGRASGEASQILALIDEPPMGFPTEYGVDPQQIGGTGSFTFELGRAMLSEVDPEDITFEIEGDFTDVSVTIPGSDVALSQADVHLVADQTRLIAEGDGQIVDTPIHIRWHEDLTAADDIASTLFEFSAALGPRALDRFGIPARQYLSGNIQVEARARSNGLNIEAIDVDADLLNATIEAPGGVWIKDEGVPGVLGFTLSTNELDHYVLEEFLARSEGLDIVASAELTRDGRLVQLDLSRALVQQWIDMNGSLAAPSMEGGAFEVELSGSYFDAREVIPRLLSLDGEGDQVPLSLTFDVGQLMVSDDTIVDDFSLIWRGEEAGVRAFLASGRTRDGPFHASFGAPQDGAIREFRVEAQSLGRLAALVGQADYASGGQMSILGEAPPLGTEGPLTARVEIRDIRLVRVPILARLLAAGSFEGLAALLNGDGISFDEITANIMLEDNLLTIDEARATGASLGVTAGGTIDFEGKTAGVDGNLAPSYVLNSLLGDMPLIGDILVSRPGEGLIGITFSVEGPFDGLTVFANPLSVLAPGVFRRIFEGTAADRAARDRSEAENAAVPLPNILPDEALEQFDPSAEAPAAPTPAEPERDETVIEQSER
jgi:hypothetical protein